MIAVFAISTPDESRAPGHAIFTHGRPGRATVA